MTACADCTEPALADFLAAHHADTAPTAPFGNYVEAPNRAYLTRALGVPSESCGAQQC